MTQQQIFAGIAAFTLSMTSMVYAEEAPRFALIRADEDYGYLAKAGAPKSWEDAAKYIPLPGSSMTYMSFGGEIRERSEVLNAAKFGLGANDDTYDLQRILLHADLHLDEHLRVFAELGAHNAFGKTQPYGPTDDGRPDLQVGFVDVKPDTSLPLTLRIGRQEMQLNDTQRFVSVREGPNIRQSFDGARAFWRDATWKADIFYFRPVTLKPGAFDDASDHTQSFYGVSVERALPQKSSIALSAFGFDRDQAKYGMIAGRERRRSISLRVAGKPAPWDYDVEVMGQFGTVAGHTIRAWGGSMDTGYTIDAPWSPRAGLRVDMGSGGGNRGTVSTFQPLFPKGAYFNETSLTSWSNLMAVRPSLRVQPLQTVTLEVSILARWRQRTIDAVYLQPATALAATLNNHAKVVGQAYGFDAAWKINRNLTVSTQLVHQAAGAAVTLAGGHDSDFAMVITQFRW